MIKSAMVIVGIVLGMLGYDNEESITNVNDTVVSAPVEQVNTITEQHIITSIDNEGYVYGENVNGTGEGIYYPMSEFVSNGVNDIKVDDVINISWLVDDYINEDWTVYSIELVE